jgi:CRP-like cAMP-binding protein
VEASQVIECRAGDRLISKDSSDRSIYVLLEGTVVVARGEQVVAVLTRGDIFGEISFLLRAPRMADVTAVSGDVKVLCLRETTLQELMVSPSRSSLAARVMLNLARVLAARLRER